MATGNITYQQELHRYLERKQTMTRLHRILAYSQPVGSWAQIHFPAPSPQADSNLCVKSQAQKQETGSTIWGNSASSIIIDNIQNTSPADSISRVKSRWVPAFDEQAEDRTNRLAMPVTVRYFETDNKSQYIVVPDTEAT